MLKRPTNWVEKPGNPNLLVHSQAPVALESEPKKRREESESKQAPEAPVLIQNKEEEEELSEKEEKYFPKPGKFEPTEIDLSVAPVLQQALEPLYSFIGMLEAESGTRVKYRWVEGASLEQRMIPINYGAKNADEFRRMNAHLGEDILGLLQDTHHIGAGIQDLHNAALPEWVGCLVGKPVFEFLLNAADLGAMQLAANELKFPLKDLIWSPEVNYMFAQYVANKFTAPKQNAFAAGIQGGQVQYRISSGFKTTGQANSKWIMGCKIWFKGAYYANNPTPAPSPQALNELLRDYVAKAASRESSRVYFENQQPYSPQAILAQRHYEDAKLHAKEAERKYVDALTASACYSQKILKHD